jgi:hypothetical protein
MTTASGGVAVVAMQIAQTDRRALSQAWYSALHLAREPARVPARTPRAAAVAAEPALAGPRDRRPADRAQGAPRAALPRPLRPAHPRIDVTGERRRPPSLDERRIGRAIAALAARPHTASTHTIALDGGRVCLIVRRDGRTTRIVALCSAALREPVRRAVAGARFALAGAGIVVGAP